MRESEEGFNYYLISLRCHKHLHWSLLLLHKIHVILRGAPQSLILKDERRPSRKTMQCSQWRRTRRKMRIWVNVMTIHWTNKQNELCVHDKKFSWYIIIVFHLKCNLLYDTNIANFYPRLVKKSVWSISIFLFWIERMMGRSLMSTFVATMLWLLRVMDCTIMS